MTISAAQPTFGQELYWGDSSASLSPLGEVTDLRPPNVSVAMVNVTTHSSTADANGGVPEEFMPAGTYDPGDIQATINHLPGGTDDLALTAAHVGRVKKYWRIVDTSATPAFKWEGYGYVQSFNPSSRGATSNAAKTAQITIKRTGVWTLGAA